MKKKLLAFMLCLSLGLPITGCNKTYDEAVQGQDDVKYCMGEYFVVETESSDASHSYKIVHAKDTGVKYFISLGTYQFGITPLYNADGTLQVYEDTKSDE